MKERILKLGRSTPLVGILTEPEKPDAEALPRAEAKPVVLLLNSGILHRVGACRIHVRLARRLASEGFAVVRFDFSGIGDSETRRDDLPFERSAVAELQEVMDQIAEQRGTETFVPMGLCSGADMALEIAKVDPRVIALGLLDLWCYRTPGYYLRRYGPKFLDPRVWLNSLRVRVEQFGGGAEEVPEYLDLPTYVREYPARNDATRDLAALVARGVRLRCIFTGGQPDDYLYEGQFAQAFRSVRFGDLLEETFIPDADHIFTNLDHQGLVLDELSGWMQRF